MAMLLQGLCSILYTCMMMGLQFRFDRDYGHTHATYIHIQALVVHFLYTVLSNRKLQLNFAIIMHNILVTFKRLEFLEKSIQIISVRIPMELNLDIADIF